eukprot:CAMPEP_0113560852 /NCGR_PEP_ID=MMETSP0015_2-20120614/19660_1 /TAXON_ID=2838 /ORGANISM="Odontella" /LENGTH=36 /DNA_ID=CAMNT_0000462601 /DNA_START=610 /DNA_END=720 /DNA_ORIENTATION=+ /assembly_acc=CAM_ASM_000160
MATRRDLEDFPELDANAIRGYGDLFCHATATMSGDI